MSDLLLVRKAKDKYATQGELYLDPGPVFLCYTLELPWLDNQRGKSCIPTGKHKLRLRNEGGFYNRYTERWDWHKGMVEVVVPDRTFILFHVGNTHKDTDGCILTGKKKRSGPLSILDSRAAYKNVYPMLYEAALNNGYLRVIDA